jgi:large subunit ribosomal protein L30
MSEQLKITLIRSMIGKPEKLRVVLKGLGLTKLNKTVVLKDTPEIQGMIRKVAHLVSVAK